MCCASPDFFLFPWRHVILSGCCLVRAWCLLEVFYNTQHRDRDGVRFEVYLTDEQRGKFLELAQRDPGQAMLIFSRISTRQSTCWVLNDQIRIHSLIESSVGFEAVDAQVREAIALALKPDGATLPAVSSAGDGAMQTLSVDAPKEKKESIMRFFCNEGLIVEAEIPMAYGEVTVRFP